MASKLSAVRSDLQRGLGILNELVARVATLSPAGDKHWPLVGNKLSHLHSDFTVHIAIIQLLLSRTTQEAQTLAELDKFTQTLQAGGETLEALRVALFPTPPNQAGEDKPSPLLTSQTETPQQLEQLSVSLRAAMASLFLSFSPGDSTPNPLPSSDSNSQGALALEEAFLRRPFALTSADVSSLVPSLGSPDPKSATEAISAQVNGLAKTWAAKQAAAGVAIEQSVLINLWCGEAWSSLPSGDLQGQLSSPGPEPAPPNEDALLAANGFVGARVRRSVSDRTSIAFIGSSGCGKSSLINAIVGFPVIAAGIPTSVPCRVRHQPGLAEPTLVVAIEPFRIGLGLLRQFNFTQQCSQWEVDYELLSIGRSEAPESFRRAWDAWITLPPLATSMLPILERLDLELSPRTTGLDQVRDMLGYLDAIALFCHKFGLLFHPLDHDWPVVSLAFEPSPDSQRLSELINLPGYAIYALSESDVPYFTRLLEEGVIFVPVISAAEDQSESIKLTRRLPELLQRLDSPIPCVIGTYLDAVWDEPEPTRKLNAVNFWGVTAKSDDVLLCSPVEGVSSKFVLHFIENHASKPPSEDVWKEQSDTRYWCVRKLSREPEMAEWKAHYEQLTTETVRERMVEFQEESHVIPTVTAYYQAISASPVCEEVAAASTRRLTKVFKEMETTVDSLLIDLGSQQDDPPRHPSAPVENLSARTLQDSLDTLQKSASEEIKRCLRTAYAELRPSHPVDNDREQANDEDDTSLLLTAETLRAILQHSHKAAELPLASLQSLVADHLTYPSLTETAVGPGEHATGGFCLPATPTLPIEALSMFQTKNPRVLLLQPLHEGYLRIRRQTTLWQKVRATGAVARMLIVWPIILLYRRQAYYWISLAEIHTRYLEEVIVPWVNDIGHTAREGTDPRCIATTSVEKVRIESRREQVDRLLALRCNVAAVLAVLV